MTVLFPELPSNPSYCSCQQGSIYNLILSLLFNRLHPHHCNSHNSLKENFSDSMYAWECREEHPWGIPWGCDFLNGRCSWMCPVSKGAIPWWIVGGRGAGKWSLSGHLSLYFPAMWQNRVMRNPLQVLPWPPTFSPVLAPDLAKFILHCCQTFNWLQFFSSVLLLSNLALSVNHSI